MVANGGPEKLVVRELSETYTMFKMVDIQCSTINIQWGFGRVLASNLKIVHWTWNRTFHLLMHLCFHSKKTFSIF